jgi:hypothetical protein
LYISVPACRLSNALRRLARSPPAEFQGEILAHCIDLNLKALSEDVVRQRAGFEALQKLDFVPMKSTMAAVVDTKPISKGARPEHHTQNSGDADVVTYEAGVGCFAVMIGHGVR